CYLPRPPHRPPLPSFPTRRSSDLEPVAGGHLPADGRVAGRVRALAEARSVGATLRVCGADGVFLQARMEDHGECMLVLIGATPEGKKELIGLSNRRHR